MTARYMVAEMDEASFAVVDVAGELGELVAYASESQALRLVRLLNALEPTPSQLDILLGRGDRRLLRRLPALRHDDPCSRCGRTIAAGKGAFWSEYTGLIRHVRCPAAASRRERLHETRKGRRE